MPEGPLSEFENKIKLFPGKYVHKQVEHRNGLVFMRLKIRKLISFY